MTDTLTALLEGARVPHRAWTFTIADPVEGVGWSEVTLHPVVPGSLRADVGSSLRGLPASTVRMVAGEEGPVVVGVDLHVARWVHEEVPTDLGAGWPETGAAAGGAAGEGVARVDGDEGLVVGEGATGLGALVVADLTGTSSMDGLLTVPAGLCLDLPGPVLDRLVGSPRLLAGPNLSDLSAVPGAMDSCDWSGPDGSVTALLAPYGPADGAKPVAPDGGSVVPVADGWAMVYPQPYGGTWTIQLVWDDVDRSLVIDVTTGGATPDLLVGLAQEIADGVPPGWHNTILGEVVRDYPDR
ncbi:hypothetical protein [Euzebya pacifica]|uniref:hypothetical protein n=1 Tax=Euzebya pacifica TaxID=1608957 RepID=UPI0013DF6B51|nr:hypothetical protein [Euzebya pacifica]